VLVVVVLAAVSVVSYPSVGGAGPTEAALRASVLTPDGNDGSSIVGATDAVTMTANPGNTGGNLRTLVWPEHAPTARDETVCATWQEASSHVVQEGLALRIAPGAAGQLAAITVTKNVYGGAEWDATAWNQALASVDDEILARYRFAACQQQNGFRHFFGSRIAPEDRVVFHPWCSPLRPRFSASG